MFPNATHAVDLVTEVNAYLLPRWMIAFGVGPTALPHSDGGRGLEH
jgi:hypothetical protein